VLLVHGVQQFSDYQVTIAPNRSIISDFFISSVNISFRGPGNRLMYVQYYRGIICESKSRNMNVNPTGFEPQTHDRGARTLPKSYLDSLRISTPLQYVCFRDMATHSDL
jgi:hypothetical protein